MLREQVVMHFLIVSTAVTLHSAGVNAFEVAIESTAIAIAIYFLQRERGGMTPPPLLIEINLLTVLSSSFSSSIPGTL